MFSLIPWRSKDKTGAEPVPAFEHPLARLRNEFEAVFDRMMGRLPVPAEAPDFERFWALDVEDTGKEVVVRAEVPGFEVKEIDVQLSGTMLTIRAQQKKEKREKKEKEVYAEKRYARYERVVPLPEGIDPEKVEAVYRNGVLEITIAKMPEAQGKKIEVKP
jgi:HSP20 family protein